MLASYRTQYSRGRSKWPMSNHFQPTLACCLARTGWPGWCRPWSSPHCSRGPCCTAWCPSLFSPAPRTGRRVWSTNSTNSISYAHGTRPHLRLPSISPAHGSRRWTNCSMPGTHSSLFWWPCWRLTWPMPAWLAGCTVRRSSRLSSSRCYACCWAPRTVWGIILFCRARPIQGPSWTCWKCLLAWPVPVPVEYIL